MWMDFPYNDFEFAHIEHSERCMPISQHGQFISMSDSHRHHHQFGLNAIEKQ